MTVQNWKIKEQKLYENGANLKNTTSWNFTAFFIRRNCVYLHDSLSKVQKLQKYLTYSILTLLRICVCFWGRHFCRLYRRLNEFQFFRENIRHRLTKDSENDLFRSWFKNYLTRAALFVFWSWGGLPQKQSNQKNVKKATIKKKEQK